MSRARPRPLAYPSRDHAAGNPQFYAAFVNYRALDGCAHVPSRRVRCEGGRCACAGQAPAPDGASDPRLPPAPQITELQLHSLRRSGPAAAERPGSGPSPSQGSEGPARRQARTRRGWGAGAGGVQGSAASVLTELWAMGLCGLGEQLVQGELGCLPEESLRGQHPDSPTASLPEAAEAPRCWPDCWDHLSTGWPHPLGASGVGGGQGGRWAALAGTAPSPLPEETHRPCLSCCALCLLFPVGERGEGRHLRPHRAQRLHGRPQGDVAELSVFV